MDNNEIRQANRKALPRFLLILLICGLIGGAIGYLSGEYGLGDMTSALEAAALLFGKHVTHWLLMAMAILIPAVCVPIYLDAKKLIAGWDGEDEDVSVRAEQKVSLVIWVSNAALILSFFILTASYIAAHDSLPPVPFFLGIAAFMAILAESIILQQKSVDTVKKMNPEKKGSAYDLRFRQKWVDSCDEAEKIIIGQCAYKAFTAVNLACTLLAAILAFCALIFGTGFLASLSVCFVWFINLTVYYRASVKYYGPGSRIL